MSPSGTEKKGDLHDLPTCAPEGLKGLRTAAEGLIQEYFQLLGSGTPSKAPDPEKVFQDKGIANPDHQATMLDNYDDHEEEVGKVKKDYEAQDDGVSVTTEGIGGAITDAYAAMDRSVELLNDKIDASHDQVITDTNDDGTTTQYLPTHTIQTVFDGIWETLDATYKEVIGVSDQAAARALNINGDESDFPGSNTTPSAYTPMSYTATPSSYSAGNSGSTSPELTQTSGSMGTAIVPTADKPDAMKIMKYLIEEHGFTPAQAAGIVANAKFESGFNVGATGDSGSAHGMFQWRFDRYAGLQEFASRPGEDIGNWETHIDYMVHELRSGSSYQQAENIVNGNPNDARAVAEGFDRHYERSSGHTINDRREYAAGVLAEWNKTNSNIAV
ncbi:phage tail tip lysozyme [Nocardia sp. NPDC051750]|uniref:phage tail tip lysozyme n=1 Tax=Nocardia sp. NPDC051750 TaxID=3364325 RepID=UPI0037AC332C